MEQKISALDVARYVIDIQSDTRLDITNLKLQKLIYYCQAYNLAMHNNPLFEEKVEAWQYGPVIPVAYREYKKWSNFIISPNPDSDKASPIKGDALSVISSVLEVYGDLSPILIMERSHRDSPWIEAYQKGNGTEITHNSMRDYYRQFIEE